MIDDFTFIAQISIKSSVAVLLATIGEIITERAGVLNLGVEGMMLVGALAGFAAGFASQNAYVAIAAGMMAGGLLSLVHAFFTIKLRSNQVLCGLALTILGTGLANFLGRPLIGAAGIRIRPLQLPYLSDIPVLGDIFFFQSPFAYGAYILVPLAWYILFKTRAGLILASRWRRCSSIGCRWNKCGPYPYPLHIYRRSLRGAGRYLPFIVLYPGLEGNDDRRPGMDCHCDGHFLYLESIACLFRCAAVRRPYRPAVLFPGRID